MAKKEKLTARLLTKPTDFSFNELTTLLGRFGYLPAEAGQTGGSRELFANEEGDYFRLHRPHPGSILKRYQVLELISFLRERGLL